MPSPDVITRWSLKDLVDGPVGQVIGQRQGELETAVSQLEAMRAELTPAIPEERFMQAVRLLEQVTGLMRRLEAYAFLWLSEDTQNEQALNLRDQLDQVLVDLGNRVLFFEIWFKDLPEESARRLTSASADLNYYFDSIRRFKPHTLTEQEEKVLALKDPNGIDAIVGLYEMLTNHFSFTMTVNGVQESLSRDQLTGYFYNPAAELRQAAYRELYRVYGENSTLLAQMYSHRVRDWYAEGIQLRNYTSPISARNLGNDLPDPVVETLLDNCRKNAAIFQRYFQFKAGALGLKKLRRFDIYAPLAGTDRKYDFIFARTLVLDTFNTFSPQVATLARRVFDRQHLDPLPRPGKRGGGFCYDCLPELTPWVLVNFDGRPGDIATLAHELGHAVHAMLAVGNSVLTFHPPQPLAETASIFGEMLLTDRLLKEETEPSVRRDLLVRVIDDAFASVIRQAYITLFEKDAHRMLVEGSSFDELADHYFGLLQEEFGQAIDLSPEFRWEWITIPHIYETPFYTYSYSFGQLLVLALYQQYQQQGQEFIPRYLKILSYGGSRAPLHILQEAGLDITSADFWQGGFDFIDRMINDVIQIK